jgi:hypothetical protein
MAAFNREITAGQLDISTPERTQLLRTRYVAARIINGALGFLQASGGGGALHDLGKTYRVIYRYDAPMNRR